MENQNTYFISKYYPFSCQLAILGMQIPRRNRAISGSEYRYAFNGMEKDDEITGVEGSHLDFGARIYDSRVGRWLSTDPLETKYPELTPYNFVANSPLQYIDPDGKDIIVPENLQDETIRVIRLSISQHQTRLTIFRPKITIDDFNKVQFTNAKYTKKAKRYVNRNINSKNYNKRYLATIYDAILSDKRNIVILPQDDLVDIRDDKSEVKGVRFLAKKEITLTIMKEFNDQIVSSNLMPSKKTKENADKSDVPNTPKKEHPMPEPFFKKRKNKKKSNITGGDLPSKKKK